MDTITNEMWMQKAIAFSARARAEMWGKHNTEIMAFVYSYGLTNHTVEVNLLGWNKRTKSRSMAGWGLAPDESDDTILFPEGILVPFVVDENLKKLTIVRHMLDSGEKNYVIPGSLSVSMTYGDKNASVKLVADNILDGLILVQEFVQTGTGSDIAVIIPDDPTAAPDPHALEYLEHAKKVVFCTEKGKHSFETWEPASAVSFKIDYSDRNRLPDDILSVIHKK